MAQWQPGGRGAHLVLQEFVLQRLVHFSGNRAKTDVRSTSRLSPHMHNGEISTRHIYYVVGAHAPAPAAASPTPPSLQCLASCFACQRKRDLKVRKGRTPLSPP